jgi:fatty-acid desaturase
MNERLAPTTHRVRLAATSDLLTGEIRYAPVKSLWFLGMTAAAIIGGAFTVSWAAVALFVVSSLLALLFGHSLGSHRKLVHNSFSCPRWLEHALVYAGVHVGIDGPLGLLRQHELRDMAQRLPQCHSFLRHGESWLVDAWWQLNCELHLQHTPLIGIEARVANNGFYQHLERRWMTHHVVLAMLFYAWGGWAFVFWGVCARVSACLLGHWAIGYLAHNHGTMPREVRGAAVQGRNIRFTSLLTMGECWHNNHHAYPGSARLGLRSNEWDPGWWVLMVGQHLGLVWHVRLPEHLPLRPELVFAAPTDASSASPQPTQADHIRTPTVSHH